MVVSDAESPPTATPRVRKFDRPPPPRDWRWCVGGLGKALIAAGLLMFGFVAYQLWGTAIETARAQNSLESEFEELLAVTSTTVATTAPAGSLPVDPAPVDPVPLDSVPDGTVPDGSDPDGSDPVGVPADPPGDAVPVAAPVQDLPPVEEGDPVARLEIPSIGSDHIVVAGVAKSDLKKGPGHYAETPLPGQLGNAAIAGHRTTYGQPFFDIDKVVTGDEIITTTLAGRFVYRVTGMQIVSPSDYQVVATTDASRATLTLTSCHPKWTARERIVVTAELDVDASTGPAGQPLINYGRPLDAGATSDPDPTSTIVGPADTSPDNPTDTGDGDSDPSSTVAVGDPTTGSGVDTDGGAEVNDGIADAFAEGWFSDPGANVQVGLWGLLLAAIGVGSYLVSRRAKRDWVGLLVGIVPFTVTLYFFFQNVNRLLPPNL